MQMADEKKVLAAKNTYATLCKVMDKIGWYYDKDEENLALETTIRGDDLNLQFRVRVDERHQIVILDSKLPFSIQKERMADVSRAINYINKRIPDGAFNMSTRYGTVYFRATECFKESLIAEEVFEDLIKESLEEVDRYNDYLFYLGMGIKTLDDFVAYVSTISYPVFNVDERIAKRTKEVFDTICEMIEDNNWRYQKDEEAMKISIGFDTDDLDIRMHFYVEAQVQKVTMLSCLPFTVNSDKVDDCALAACEANYNLKDGDFLYDFDNNAIFFKLTTSYRGSLISKSLMDGFLDFAYAVLDFYNDKFQAVNDGQISLEDFAKSLD